MFHSILDWCEKVVVEEDDWGCKTEAQSWGNMFGSDVDGPGAFFNKRSKRDQLELMGSEEYGEAVTRSDIRVARRNSDGRRELPALKTTFMCWREGLFLAWLDARKRFFEGTSKVIDEAGVRWDSCLSFFLEWLEVGRARVLFSLPGNGLVAEDIHLGRVLVIEPHGNIFSGRAPGVVGGVVG